MLNRFLLAALCLCLTSLSVFAAAPVDDGVEEGKTHKALFLTKSSGFQHSTITRHEGELSHTEKIMVALGKEVGVEFECTKDAHLINAEDLQNYDLVVFYTSGDLTKESGDGGSAMPETGVQDLVNWIKQGGGFMGFHSASDTFKAGDGPINPYIEMLCGEFAGHGPQFDGTVYPTLPLHPTMESIPTGGWTIHEEWYVFRNVNKDAMHAVGVLDPGEARNQHDMYKGPNHPIIWCRTLGDGRVFYNAMGHREDVWSHDTFQASIRDAIRWTLGHGPAQAKPNYERVLREGLTAKDAEQNPYAPKQEAPATQATRETPQTQKSQGQ